jgi:hypothetical protein
MINTKRSTRTCQSITSAYGPTAIRRALGPLAIGLALLVVPQTYAQDTQIMSLLNGGFALSTGGITVDGAPIVTELWDGAIRQRWQFEVDYFDTSRYYYPILQRPYTISTMVITSPVVVPSRYLDVFRHLPLPGGQIIQSGTQILIDDTLTWRYQRWFVNPVSKTPDGLTLYTVQNSATGMCLTNMGTPPGGGAVVEFPCDSNAQDDMAHRQKWTIYNWNLGRPQ